MLRLSLPPFLYKIPPRSLLSFEQSTNLYHNTTHLIKPQLIRSLENIATLVAIADMCYTQYVYERCRLCASFHEIIISDRRCMLYRSTGQCNRSFGWKVHRRPGADA